MVARIPWQGGTTELYAAAEGTYNRPKQELTVKLDCYVSAVRFGSAPASSMPEWLPKPEVVQVKIGADEAVEETRQVFQAYVKRLHHALDTPHVTVEGK